jgi:hypothetical protein
MSKSPIRTARHFAAAVVGVLASLAAVCAAAPAAFAMPLSPVDQGTGATVASHSGTPGWEIALIAIGAVMLVSLLVAVVLHRHAPARLNRAVS